MLGMQVTRLEKDKKTLESRLEDERLHLAETLEKHDSTLASLRSEYECRESDLKQAMKKKVTEIL